MKKRTRTSHILGSAALFGMLASVAQAGTITFYTAAFGTTPITTNDTLTLPTPGASSCIGNIGGNTATCPTLGNPATLTTTINSDVNGDPLSFAFTFQNAEVFSQSTSGSPYTTNANFSNGESLLNTVQASSLTITFGTPVSSFGFDIQESDFGSFTFAAVMNVNGNTGCVGITNSCLATTSGTGGNPIFIGLQTSGAALINSVLITTSSISGPGTGNFLIGGIVLDDASTGGTPPPSVPEPSTFAMIGGGLLALGFKARKLVKV